MFGPVLNVDCEGVHQHSSGKEQAPRLICSQLLYFVWALPHPHTSSTLT